MMKKLLTFAILGAGRMGRMHACDLFKMPDVRVKTILDRYMLRDWLPQNTTTEITNDLSKILNDKEIDAIVIATSSSTHVEFIKAILPYQKHIFSEKPVSFSSQTLRSLEKLVTASGIKFQIGYNRRHDPHIGELKKRLAQNKLGQMYMVKIINRDKERPPLSFIPKSGGMLFDFSSHDFDMIHFLSGSQIESIYTLGASLVDPQIAALGDIDTALISMKLSNGALATIDCSREAGYGYDQQIEVFGANGSLHMQNVRQHTILDSQRKGISIAAPRSTFIERYREAYEAQMRHFINWVAYDETPQDPVGIAEGIKAIAVAEAAAKSLKSGTPEKVAYDQD